MNEDPNSRASQQGWAALNDAELLSFLLTRGGLPGPAALETARWVLAHVGGLQRLVKARQGQLCQVAGIGPVRARRLLAFAMLSRRIAEKPLARGDLCDSPQAVYDSLRGRFGCAMQESFLVVLLDARLRKIEEIEVARGQANSVAVTPREVFGPAVLERAVSVVLVHNHPSGDPNPSVEDISLTTRLHAAGELLGIPVNDHLVVTDQGFSSLAAMGYLPSPPESTASMSNMISLPTPVDSPQLGRHNDCPCIPSCSRSSSSDAASPTTPTVE